MEGFCARGMGNAHSLHIYQIHFALWGACGGSKLPPYRLYNSRCAVILRNNTEVVPYDTYTKTAPFVGADAYPPADGRGVRPYACVDYIALCEILRFAQNDRIIRIIDISAILSPICAGRCRGGKWRLFRQR